MRKGQAGYKQGRDFSTREVNLKSTSNPYLLSVPACIPDWPSLSVSLASRLDLVDTTNHLAWVWTLTRPARLGCIPRPDIRNAAADNAGCCQGLAALTHLVFWRHVVAALDPTPAPNRRPAEAGVKEHSMIPAQYRGVEHVPIANALDCLAGSPQTDSGPVALPGRVFLPSLGAGGEVGALKYLQTNCDLCSHLLQSYL